VKDVKIDRDGKVTVRHVDAPAPAHRALCLDLATTMGWAITGGDSGVFALWREPRIGRSPRSEERYVAGPKKGQVKRAADPGVPAVDDGPKDSRLLRLWMWLDRERMKVGIADFDAVVIEGVDSGWTGGRNNADATRVANELRGVVKLWCQLRSVPLVEVTPKDLKLDATGTTNADKPTMLAAARALTGYDGDSHDEADARLLRRWAERHLAVHLARAPQ
jgi:hypothetical protein